MCFHWPLSQSLNNGIPFRDYASIRHMTAMELFGTGKRFCTISIGSEGTESRHIRFRDDGTSILLTAVYGQCEIYVDTTLSEQSLRMCLSQDDKFSTAFGISSWGVRMSGEAALVPLPFLRTVDCRVRVTIEGCDACFHGRVCGDPDEQVWRLHILGFVWSLAGSHSKTEVLYMGCTV
jgi:hypothetical protein